MRRNVPRRPRLERWTRRASFEFICGWRFRPFRRRLSFLRMSSLLPATLAPLARVECERGSFTGLGVLAPLHLLKLLDRDLAALLRLSRLAQLALVSRLDADAAATLTAAAALALPGHGDRVPEIGSVHTFSAGRACACAWSAVP